MEKHTDSSSEVATTTEAPVEEKKLSRRDALEVAIMAHEAPEPEPEVKEAAPVEEKKEEEVLPPLEPPAEWTKDEKEDFRQLTRKSQEAALRIHKGRVEKLEEIKRESAELSWAKELAKQTQLFYRARGEKEPSPQDMVRSLQIVNDLSSSQNAATIKQVLQAKGLPVPKSLDDVEEDTGKDEALAPVLSKVSALEEKLAAQEREREAVVLQQLWSSFEGAKNAAGSPRYPDLNETEAGLRLASSIGSLVQGRTELSQQFLAAVKARIPDATPERVLEEAYRFYGGRVDESTAPTKTDPQEHLKKSSLAAASVPGRGAANGFTPPVKKLSRREWLAQAIELAKQNSN